MFANLLIGSIPRQGKTVAMRNVLLAAALDPLAELHVHELKGTGDLGPLEKVAHRYGPAPMTPRSRPRSPTCASSPTSS
jgi:DNA segregation ATPase FtsK/SpoIIIE, S-DNA-T family